jgi:uncharacterized membrane protein
MKVSRVVAFAGLCILCTGVAVYSAWYWMPGMAPSGFEPLRNGFGPTLLGLHAGSASLALLAGPWQLHGPLRAARPGLHRLLGRLYAVAVATGGLSGLALAAGSLWGPVVQAGFGSLAVIWLSVTGLGVRAALKRDFPSHRRWMVRSVALTFGALALRVEMPLLIASGLSFQTTYQIVSFLAWVPHLLIAEIWLNTSRLRAAWAHRSG